MTIAPTRDWSWLVVNYTLLCLGGCWYITMCVNSQETWAAQLNNERHTFTCLERWADHLNDERHTFICLCAMHLSWLLAQPCVSSQERVWQLLATAPSCQDVSSLGSHLSRCPIFGQGELYNEQVLSCQDVSSLGSTCQDVPSLGRGTCVLLKFGDANFGKCYFDHHREYKACLCTLYGIL